MVFHHPTALAFVLPLLAGIAATLPGSASTAADDDPVRRLGAQDRWATAAILGHFAHRDRRRRPGAYADDVTRVAGAGRFATAAAVSKHRGIAAEEAFVATGEDFPDVLAAAPAAISTNSALLLTGQGTLPEATRAEITRLEVESATVAGHQSAVSDTVADELRRLLGYDPTVDG